MDNRLNKRRFFFYRRERKRDISGFYIKYLYLRQDSLLQKINMKRIWFMLFLTVMVTACQNRKKQSETVSSYEMEQWTDEQEETDTEVYRNYRSDTLRFKDGTFMHWYEQERNSPFHRLVEIYGADGRIKAQTAMQYGRATDQILLYEYDNKERLTCIHEYPSGLDCTEEKDNKALKQTFDSLFRAGIKSSEDMDAYVDYRLSYNEQGNLVSLSSRIMDKQVNRDEFGKADKHEVKVIENAPFWISDNHGGTLLVCQIWDSKDGKTGNYTGCRGLAVNLKKIWRKEYVEGELVRFTFYHRANMDNEEKVYDVQRQKQADCTTLYIIKDKDDVTTRYIWRNGFPVHCIKRSVYNTVLYEASFTLDGKDVVIDESVYNYRTKRLEKQPAKHQSHVGYNEQDLMNLKKMFWDEYDYDDLPPDSFMK